MAEALAAARKATAQSTAKQTGTRIGQPYITVGNQMIGTQQGGLEELPTDLTDWKPLQVTNASDANCGKFYFMPGYDMPGDPNKVVR